MHHSLEAPHKTVKQQPRVTIVIATYNRANSLEQTIRCAIAQTMPHWTMLVIGDACTDHTAQTIAHFEDERIHFINLPERFGEQSGPNSVGMMLAETEFVAFLNHDDLWLPNHLSLAVSQLEDDQTDIYWSRAAFFKNRGPRVDSPLFAAASPMNRTLAEAYDAPFFYSEPISSWVCYTSSLRKLGVMSLSSETSITPLQDYTIRAWKQGFQLSSGSCITILKDNMIPVRLPHEPKKNSYEVNNSQHIELVHLLNKDDKSVLYKKIETDIWLSEHLGLTKSFGSTKPREQELGTDLFSHTGIDLLHSKASAADKGFMGILGNILEVRTGERLTSQPDLNAMIEFARTQLKGTV